MFLAFFVDHLATVKLRHVKHVRDLIQVRVNLSEVQNQLELRDRICDSVQHTGLVVRK